MDDANKGSVPICTPFTRSEIGFRDEGAFASGPPDMKSGSRCSGIMALFVVPLFKRTQCSSLLPATGTEVSTRRLRLASPVRAYAPPATSATSIVCRVRMCKAVYVYRLSFFAKQTATESEIGNNCTLGSVNVRA